MDETQMEFQGFSLTVPDTVQKPLKTAALLCESLVSQQEILEDGLAMDMGCGSGILALQLGKLGAQTVLAVDLNPDAITTTSANWQRNDFAEERFLSFVSDGFKAIPGRYRGKIDLIVSNPPVQPQKYTRNQAATKGYHWNEAGNDGRAVLDHLLTEGIQWLRPKGVLIFSCSSRHGWQQTQKLLNDYQATQAIQQWRLLYEELLPLQTWQEEYLAFWLEVQTEADPRIFLKDGVYYHRFMIIELTR